MSEKIDLFGKQTPVNEFDKRCSTLLANAITKNGLVRRRIFIKKWIASFKELRTGDGMEEKRIKEVLKWFLLHIKDDYTPKAYSASGFRKKFFRIEAAMKLDRKQGEFDDFEVTVIRDDGDEFNFEIDYGDGE